MPTPFMHLAAAQRLLHDDTLPPADCGALRAQLGPFLLGNVAADARVSGHLARASTHFFECDGRPLPSAWAEMLTSAPTMRRNGDSGLTDRAAFAAGYVAHLAMDVTLCRTLVQPYLVASRGTPAHTEARWRWHLLLAWLDARAYAALPVGFCDALVDADPAGWAPFIPDAVLRGWRDLIATQLPGCGPSQTHVILAERVNASPDAFLAIIQSPEAMAREVWHAIPRGEVEQAEVAMYAHMRHDVQSYLSTQFPGEFAADPSRPFTEVE